MRSETKRLSKEMMHELRVPYVMRRVPEASLTSLTSCADSPRAGTLALTRLEKLGKNTHLELVNGRRCTLHEGDLVAVAFGNRYATQQFEGYAKVDGDRCDLLSMGGLCGLVASKHASMREPTKLRLLGLFDDGEGRPLHLRQFALPVVPSPGRQRVIVVCGTSMDSGKTHTAMSVIVGLKRHGYRVASIKLTGVCSGRDTWAMLDAGARPALDFVDGGYASTYLCGLEELLDLYDLLSAHSAAEGAECLVVEIADGLLQKETAALLQCSRFTATVDAWVFTAIDSLGALEGVNVLRGWGSEVTVISGVISMSPLGMQEIQAASGVRCLTDEALQQGALNGLLKEPVCSLASRHREWTAA